MRIFKLCLGAALLMAIVAAGFAHADVELAGTTAASFLTNGTGPRVLSMGGATLALGGDLQSAAWNPAALATLTSGEFALAHGGLAGDQQQEWFGAGGRLGHSATRWGMQGLYQGNGSFEGRDASNNPTGNFTAASFAVGAQLAENFGDRGAVGLGAKFVNEKLGDVSGMGMTFDFGGQLRAGRFGLGASASNVGGQMRYSNAIYSFPTSYGAGVSFSMPGTGLNLAADVNMPKSYYGDLRFGAEWRWRDMLALRTGYRHEMNPGGISTPDALSGPTFGLGAGYNGMWLDYGYLVSNAGGASEQRMAITFHPGGFGLGGGASLGDNGTGASHAPTTAALKTTARTAVSVPAPRPSRKSSLRHDDSNVATTTPGASSAHGASLTPTTSDDAKTAEKAAPTSAPAVVDKPVSTPAASEKSTSTSDTPAAAAKSAITPESTPAPVSPPAAKHSARAVVDATTAPRPETVTVHSGDTIASIARKYGTSIPAIMMENNMVSEKIRGGQKLKLPRQQ